MNERVKMAGLSVGSLVTALVLVFVLGLAGLGYYKFFAPRRENVRREVFEQTKSYVHGKIQDLAKHKAEYDRAETDEDKEAIQAVIRHQFAAFDVSQIDSPELRACLKRMRGY